MSVVQERLDFDAPATRGASRSRSRNYKKGSAAAVNQRVGPPCSVDGCETVAVTRGWCCKHYNRWRKHGDPTFRVRVRTRRPIEDRFWEKVDKTETCWLWTAGKNHDGYGYITVAVGQQLRAHRFAYELLVGPIPEGLTVDHLCGNRACVNPEHLEAVTAAENARRANLKSHCSNGHKYTAENVWVDSRGWRHCKECGRLRRRRSRSEGTTS